MHRLWHPERPLTINKERELPYQARNRIMQAWREAFYLLAAAERMPGYAHIKVTAQIWLPDRRWRQDLGNALPSVKAAVDGLVDYGVIPDDTDEYLRELCFVPNVIGQQPDPGLLLLVEGIDKQARRWEPKNRPKSPKAVKR